MNFRSQYFLFFGINVFKYLQKDFDIFKGIVLEQPKPQRYTSLSTLLERKIKCISCSSVKKLTLLVKAVCFSFLLTSK